MKIILIFLLLLAIVSCSNKDEETIKELTKKIRNDSIEVSYLKSENNKLKEQIPKNSNEARILIKEDEEKNPLKYLKVIGSESDKHFLGSYFLRTSIRNLAIYTIYYISYLEMNMIAENGINLGTKHCNLNELIYPNQSSTFIRDILNYDIDSKYLEVKILNAESIKPSNIKKKNQNQPTKEWG